MEAGLSHGIGDRDAHQARDTEDTADDSTGIAKPSSPRPTTGCSIDASSSMMSMFTLRARLNRLLCKRLVRG